MGSKYVSSGTISYQIEGTKRWVLFVPDRDHSVTHRGRNYAVFLRDDNFDAAIVRQLKDNWDSIRLELEAANPDGGGRGAALPSAAIKQCRIDVVVAKNGGEGLTLIGVTVPARGKT